MGLPVSLDVRDLVTLLRHHARTKPGHLAYVFEATDSEVRVTYGELDRQARAIAARLQEMGGRGDRALLLFPPGLDFIAGFFGCLYAGVIAIPAFPPREAVRPSDRNRRRVLSIARDASPRFVLSTARVRDGLKGLAAAIPGFDEAAWIATDALGDARAAWVEETPEADAIAFLQYTSGSTGTPKGVIVTHRNILANERMIATAFRHDEHCVGGGWLPLFHDMGLIGNVLQALYLGVPFYLMAPTTFAMNPTRWLELISRHRVTTSGAPDFAYRLCAQTVNEEEKAKLDLSSWRVAFSGAEPVRQATIDLFASAFERCGFRREAFFPVYGLAEATLFVSGGVQGEPPTSLTLCRSELDRGRAVDAADVDPMFFSEASRTVVSCGRSAAGQRLLVVDPNTREEVAENEVGEVWIAGPHVTAGYWNRERETRERFGVALAGSDERAFCRTGDLGFLRDGDLFLVGRSSDMIIVRGANHYPEDIEVTVERVDPRFLTTCVVSVEEGGEERLVVLQEVGGSFRAEHAEEVASHVRRAVAESHELDVSRVVFVRRGALSMTSSGKVQRRENRDRYVAGELKVVAVSARALESGVDVSLESTPDLDHDVRVWLIAFVAKLAKLAPHEIDPNRPLTDYGLDSAAALVIAGALEKRIGYRLPPSLAWDRPTIASVIDFIADGPPSVRAA